MASIAARGLKLRTCVIRRRSIKAVFLASIALKAAIARWKKTLETSKDAFLQQRNRESHWRMRIEKIDTGLGVTAVKVR